MFERFALNHWHVVAVNLMILQRCSASVVEAITPHPLLVASIEGERGMIEERGLDQVTPAVCQSLAVFSAPCGHCSLV